MEDMCLANQQLYCKYNKLPMFASSGCSHQNEWHSNVPADAPTGNLTDMMVYKYGGLTEALRISASTFITACPICSRAWDD